MDRYPSYCSLNQPRQNQIPCWDQADCCYHRHCRYSTDCYARIRRRQEDDHCFPPLCILQCQSTHHVSRSTSPTILCILILMSKHIYPAVSVEYRLQERSPLGFFNAVRVPFCTYALLLVDPVPVVSAVFVVVGGAFVVFWPASVVSLQYFGVGRDLNGGCGGSDSGGDHYEAFSVFQIVAYNVVSLSIGGTGLLMVTDT